MRTRIAFWLCTVLGAWASAFSQGPPRLIAQLISKIEPLYPEIAKKKGIEGAVRLDATIGKDGRVIKVQSISGSPVLVKAAKDAVMQWVYRPTLLNGEPIEVITDVCVPFVHSKQTPPLCGTGRIRR